MAIFQENCIKTKVKINNDVHTNDPSSAFPLTKLVETCFFFSFTTFFALSKLHKRGGGG